MQFGNAHPQGATWKNEELKSVGDENIFMHQNFTKHERFCEQNNQLPTKIHVELKDNSIEPKILGNVKRCLGVCLDTQTST